MQYCEKPKESRLHGKFFLTNWKNEVPRNVHQSQPNEHNVLHVYLLKHSYAAHFNNVIRNYVKHLINFVRTRVALKL